MKQKKINFNKIIYLNIKKKSKLLQIILIKSKIKKIITNIYFTYSFTQNFFFILYYLINKKC